MTTIEARFAEIAKVAEANGGRILFAEKLEALLRSWYTTGIADAGGLVREGDGLRIVRSAYQPETKA